MGPAEALADMDELVEEFLLRSPPDDPAHLVRAALVCKRWCRILTGAGFRRRFREFHRSPPMLGFLHRPPSQPPYDAVPGGFAPTTSFRATNADLGGRHVLDARHGRVLIGRLPKMGDHPDSDARLSVWDPVTGEKLDLPEPLLCGGRRLLNWNAAVLCASSRDGVCDHLDCNRGHFLVVVVDNRVLAQFAYVYSSEEGAWSGPPTDALQLDPDGNIIFLEQSEPSVLAGNALYFIISTNEAGLNNGILKYDLGTSMFDTTGLLPWTSRDGKSVVLTATDSGGLGCAIAEHSKLSLWSRVAGPNEHWVWSQTRVIDLEKIICGCDDILHPYILVGYAHGLDVLFVLRHDGYFTVDLKSGGMKRVCSLGAIFKILPYTSFCTPALRVISTGEGPSPGVSSAQRTLVTSKSTESAVSTGEGPSAGASSA